MKFDSEVNYQRHLRDLYRLHLMNFNKVRQFTNARDLGVTVQMFLANMIEETVAEDEKSN